MSGVVFLIIRILLALTLYIFLVITLITMWRDLKFQQDIVTANKKFPSIRIKIMEDQVSKTYKYQGPDISIGRHPSSDLVLNSEKVSADHAHLYYDQNQWWLEDQNSTNGSFLNKEMIKKPAVVTDGDILQCGDIELTVILYM